MALSIAFWVLAAIAVVAALAVMMQRDIFHAALSLILCFLAVAGLFVTLSADFLAAMQVLIYVGAVAILIILGVMLTREVQRGNVANHLVIPAFIIAALLLGILVFVITRTPWPVSTAMPLAPTVGPLSIKLFGQDGFLLAVEIAPVLLLAAVLGAIALVREK
ncbi:MAG: NADH-quinone oxidoreductase subunit J [Chloroflexota bacterium]